MGSSSLIMKQGFEGEDPRRFSRYKSDTRLQTLQNLEHIHTCIGGYSIQILNRDHRYKFLLSYGCAKTVSG
jgi:hypothetical protein